MGQKVALYPTHLYTIKGDNFGYLGYLPFPVLFPLPFLPSSLLKTTPSNRQNFDLGLTPYRILQW